VKANQGMRQPQMGGVQSQLQLARPNPLCSHREVWRLNPDSKWICLVCHPPAVSRFVEIRTLDLEAT
jgi:hypothetical protein